MKDDNYFDWKCSYECVSDVYEDFFWQDSTSFFLYKSGLWYFARQGEQTGGLYTWSGSGDAKPVLLKSLKALGYPGVCLFEYNNEMYYGIGQYIKKLTDHTNVYRVVGNQYITAIEIKENEIFLYTESEHGDRMMSISLWDEEKPIQTISPALETSSPAPATAIPVTPLPDETTPDITSNPTQKPIVTLHPEESGPTPTVNPPEETETPSGDGNGGNDNDNNVSVPGGDQSQGDQPQGDRTTVQTPVQGIQDESNADKADITAEPGMSAKTVRKPARVSKVKVKKSGSKAKISWKKVKGCSYQVQVSQKKSFKKAVKKTVKAAKSKVSVKRKKTYYVRVRAWRTFAGKKVYGRWSRVAKYRAK